MADKMEVGEQRVPSTTTTDGGSALQNRNEDFIKCISDLDAMLEEFDDTSLPYSLDFEVPCDDLPGRTNQEELLVEDSPMVTTPEIVSHHQSSQGQMDIFTDYATAATTAAATTFSSTANLVLTNATTEVLDHNKNVDLEFHGDDSRGHDDPVRQTAYSTQIAVADPIFSHSSGAQGPYPSGAATFKVVKNQPYQSSSLSERRHRATTTDADFTTHVVVDPGICGDLMGNESPQKAGGAFGSNTYSKGTGSKFITNSEGSHSANGTGKGTVTKSSIPSRPSILLPNIDSLTGLMSSGTTTSQTQVNTTIFEPVFQTVQSCNDGAQSSSSKTSTLDTTTKGSISKGSDRQQSSERCDSAAMKKNDYEEWNFLSENNLPRSLRKTRKTTHSDDVDLGGKVGKIRPKLTKNPTCSSSGEFLSSNDRSSGYSSCSLEVNANNMNCQDFPKVAGMVMDTSSHHQCQMCHSEGGKISDDKHLHHGLSSGLRMNPRTEPHIMTGSSADFCGILKSSSSSPQQVLNVTKITLNEQTSKPADLNLTFAPSSSTCSNPIPPNGKGGGVTLGAPFDRECTQKETPPESVISHKSSKSFQNPSSTESNQGIPFLHQNHPDQSQLPHTSEISCPPNVGVVPPHPPLILHELVENRAQFVVSPSVVVGGSPTRVYCGDESCRMGDGGDCCAYDSNCCGRRRGAGGGGGGGDKQSSSFRIPSGEVITEGDGRRSLPIKGQGKKGRMMMRMMQPSAKNLDVSSACSSSRRSSSSNSGSHSISSSSSGSVSVKSSTTSVSNSGDDFHETMLLDYPPNVLNLATTVGANHQRQDSLEKDCDASDGPIGNERLADDTGENREVVVMDFGSKIPRAVTTSEGAGAMQRLPKGGVKPLEPQLQTTTSHHHSPANEIDDGYLSMINRSGAPVIWPDELVVNEVFSTEELTRRGSKDFDRMPTAGKHDVMADINSKLLLLINTPPAGLGRDHVKKGRQSRGGARRRSPEKTDYFSDDSLELEGEDCLIQSSTLGKLEGSPLFLEGSAAPFTMPAHSKDRHSRKESQTSKSASFSGGGSKVGGPNFKKQGSPNVSKIPTMIQKSVAIKRTHNNKHHSPRQISTSSPQQERCHSSPATPVRKPCSFFIPFTTTDSKSRLGASLDGEVRPLNDISSSPNRCPPLRLLKGRLTYDKSSSVQTNPPVGSTVGSLKVESSGPSSTELSQQCGKDSTTTAASHSATCTSSLSTTTSQFSPLPNPNLSPQMHSRGDSVVLTCSSRDSNSDLLKEKIAPSAISAGDEERGVAELGQIIEEEKATLLTKVLSPAHELEGEATQRDTNGQPLKRQSFKDNEERGKHATDQADTVINNSMKDYNGSDSKLPDDTLEIRNETGLKIVDLEDKANKETMMLASSNGGDLQENLVQEVSGDVSAKLQSSDGVEEVVALSVSSDGIESSSATHDVQASHDKVADELDSMVEMFLKAAEGFLYSTETDITENEPEVVESSNLPWLPGGEVGEEQKQRLPGDKESVKAVGSREQEDVVDCGRNCTAESVSVLATNQGRQESLLTNTIVTGLPTKGIDDSQCDTHLEVRETVIEDWHDQPPAFIPEPPPATNVAPQIETISKEKVSEPVLTALPHVSSVNDCVGVDLLSQRISSSKYPQTTESMSVSQFLQNKKNIWAMYDRPYDEDLSPPGFPRGFSSKSQENLFDAVTKERLKTSFSARGQSSTLPLNCRPPPVHRRTNTFRNMFNKLMKHKTTATVASSEGSDMRDEEAQSITSRETGPSEGRKRGFFSRLFRRNRK